MTVSMAQIVRWTPRVLGLAFVAFLSMFALDVFNEGLSVGRTAIALATHLIPAAIMLLTVLVAWRWPAIGGGLLIGAGLWYSLSVGRTHPAWIVVVAAPAFVVGGLFLMESRRRKATAAH